MSAPNHRCVSFGMRRGLWECRVGDELVDGKKVCAALSLFFSFLSYSSGSSPLLFLVNIQKLMIGIYWTYVCRLGPQPMKNSSTYQVTDMSGVSPPSHLSATLLTSCNYSTPNGTKSTPASST